MAPTTGINPTTGQAIDLGKATQAATRLDHAHDIINGLKVRLQGHAAELAANWDSKASRSFQSVFDEFNQDFQKQLQALAEMHQKLIHTKAHYESSRDQQTDIVNRVHQLINNNVNHAGTAQ
ncbi:WXG100 family type VII secretion target [Actinoallomurus sp. NBC_01490]|jgi:WXG100 family type VII secretion target|uniref:WXG100 family type VII secretion target n=1 Tax=Actinoallomurus sp. NBC_01490 TaxID=2903557 RepID=UPI002E37620B|nr:WXG100 family type VII secretion target [Actinoallomurus sp. NBC_01490]